MKIFRLIQILFMFESESTDYDKPGHRSPRRRNWNDDVYVPNIQKAHLVM